MYDFSNIIFFYVLNKNWFMRNIVYYNINIFSLDFNYYLNVSSTNVYILNNVKLDAAIFLINHNTNILYIWNIIYNLI